jgi:hypothetical protein
MFWVFFSKEENMFGERERGYVVVVVVSVIVSCVIECIIFWFDCRAAVVEVNTTRCVGSIFSFF